MEFRVFSFVFITVVMLSTPVLAQCDSSCSSTGVNNCINNLNSAMASCGSDDLQCLCDAGMSYFSCIDSVCPMIQECSEYSSYWAQMKQQMDDICAQAEEQKAEEERQAVMTAVGGVAIVGGIGAAVAISAHNAKAKKLKTQKAQGQGQGQEMVPVQPPNQPMQAPGQFNPMPSAQPGAPAQPAYLQPLQVNPANYAQNQAVNAAQQQMNFSQQQKNQGQQQQRQSVIMMPVMGANGVMMMQPMMQPQGAGGMVMVQQPNGTMMMMQQPIYQQQQVNGVQQPMMMMQQQQQPNGVMMQPQPVSPSPVPQQQLVDQTAFAKRYSVNY